MKNSYLIPVLFLFMSCTAGLNDYMGRSASDPEIIAPRIASFIETNAVLVEWNEDDCADEYALYRALDSDRNFSLLYQGTELSFRDDSVLAETRYLYTLSKIRGNTEFGPSPSVMGVGSSTIQDVYEPNDSYEDATLFTYDLYANVYGYKSIGFDHSIIDRDYYCVTVKPHMTASYTVGISSASSGDGTDLKLQRRYYDSEDITNYDEIAFDNPSSNTVSFYFAIYPDENAVASDVDSGGGRFIGYELKYIGEVPSGTGD